jgi:hypothetical protein
VSPLVGKRHLPEGERAAVESSHGGALSRTLPKVTHVVLDDGSDHGGTLRSSPKPAVVARSHSYDIP